MCTHLEPFVHILMFLSGKLWTAERERAKEVCLMAGLDCICSVHS